MQEREGPLVDQVESALDGLLVAMIADEAGAGRRAAAARTIKATPFSFASKGEVHACEERVSSLIRDPVGRACREQIRFLGQVVFDVTGSTDGMRTVLERVADRDPGKAGRRAAIMDTCWSGTGLPGKDLWFA